MASNSTNVSVENVVFSGVLDVLSRKGSWSGTMTDLTRMLVRSGQSRTVLPGSPSALRVVLNRVVNRLRNRGVSVKFGRTTDHTRTRYVKFVK